MDRSQKEALVNELKSAFTEAGVVVVTHQNGLTVAEVTDLRAKLRETGGRFKVTKNRITRLALEGTPYQGLADLFTGPTAIAFSEDVTAATKVAVNFAKENDKLTILGGAIGEKALDVDGVKALASLPSLEESRAKLVGLLQAPATKVAGVLQAPAGQLARVFGAYAASGNAA